MSRGGALLVVASAVVVVAIIGGLRVAGSPDEARLESIDDRRVQDLKALAGPIEFREKDGQGDVATLYRDAIHDQPDHATDPVTHAPYRFRVRPDGGFDVGARFDRPRDAATMEPYERDWAHGAGEWWFEFPAGRVRTGPDTSHAGP